MTVSTTTRRAEYVGDGLSSQFNINFKIGDEDWIYVYLDGEALTADKYTVTIENEFGGYVTITDGATVSGSTGKDVVILRTVPYTQESDYKPNDPFPAEVHEDDLDKSTMIDQQLKEQLDRVVAYPEGEALGTFNLTLPTPLVPLYHLGVNAAGTALEWQDPSGDPLATASGVWIQDGANTYFTSGDVSVGMTTYPGAFNVTGESYFYGPVTIYYSGTGIKFFGTTAYIGFSSDVDLLQLGTSGNLGSRNSNFFCDSDVTVEFDGDVWFDGTVHFGTTQSFTNINAGGTIHADGNITTDGTVDGVDIAAFYTAFLNEVHNATQIQGRDITSDAPDDGNVIYWNAGASEFQFTTMSGGGGSSDHGTLLGLLDDDHTQYLLRTDFTTYSGSLQDQIDTNTSLTQDNDTQITTLSGNLDTHTSDSTIHFTEASIDHGSIAGLSDDDHTQYVRVDGTRAFTGKVGGIDPTVDAHLATKKYVDDEVAAGLNDHGALTGLADDDHTQYTRVDGTRAFTGEVGGITPVVDAHLTTKGYVDGEIATLSGTIVLDHGNLTGLSDDDHTQYALVDGTRDFSATVGYDSGAIVPVSLTDFANKGYVDDQISSVSGTSIGKVYGEDGTYYDAAVPHDYITISGVNGLDTTVSGQTIILTQNIDHSTLDNLDYASSGHTGFAEAGHTHTESDVTDLDHDAEKIRGKTVASGVASPSDDDFLRYESTSGEWELHSPTTWKVVAADTGTATPTGLDTVLTVQGKGSVNASATGTTLTISGSAATQNLYESIYGDSGSHYAETTASNLYILGAGTITTTVASGITGITNVTISGSNTPGAHTHTESEITDLQDYVTEAEFTTYSGTLQDQIDTNTSDIADNTSLISTTSGTLQDQLDALDYYTTGEVDTISGSLSAEIDSDISTHSASGDHDGRYYTETELDAGQLDNRYYTETEVDDLITTTSGGLQDNLDAHTGDSTIHFLESSIDHTNIQNIGTNSHADIDTHIVDGTIHFTEAIIDHRNIMYRGTNSHSQIDTHLALTNEHIDWTDATQNLNTEGNVTVGGDLVVSGTQFISEVEEVLIEDNLLVVNYGEPGAGVTEGTAGIEVDRGSETNYLFVFDETDDNFQVGVSGTLQPVATREDTPTNSGIAYWDGSNYRFVTDADFTYEDDVLYAPTFSGTFLGTYSHNHDDRYYTESELDGGQLDNRYYTETEIDNFGFLTTVSGGDHTTLTNIGTNSHADIDTHIADAGKHREINDSGSGSTDLWSADKISTELATKGDMNDLVDDTTPQLGGDLDLNGKNIDFGSILTSNGTYTGDHMTVTVSGTPAFGDLLGQSTDFGYTQADADAAATSTAVVMALESGDGSKKVLLRGQICDTSWNWSAGYVYISTTAGELTQTKPSGSGDQVMVAGWALSADTIWFEPTRVLVEIT